MDEQFIIDVPRIVLFVDEEWIPSSEPQEVWDRLIAEYDGDMRVVQRAARCLKQCFLSDYYINEITDINFLGTDDGSENLLSHSIYKIVINSLSGQITITKDFIHSIIYDGEMYEMDYCILTVVYDPYVDKEISCNWNYTIHDMMKSNKKSFILSKQATDFI